MSIRLGHEDLKGDDILAVTDSQVRKLANTLENDRGITIRMSSKQLKHNTKIEGGFLGLLAGFAVTALPLVAENRLTGVRRWCSFRVSPIGSTKSDRVGSLPQERRIIPKTVQRPGLTVLR